MHETGCNTANTKGLNMCSLVTKEELNNKNKYPSPEKQERGTTDGRSP